MAFTYAGLINTQTWFDQFGKLLKNTALTLTAHGSMTLWNLYGAASRAPVLTQPLSTDADGNFALGNVFGDPGDVDVYRGTIYVGTFHIAPDIREFSGAAGPPGPTLNPRGTYSGATTYAAFDQVNWSASGPQGSYYAKAAPPVGTDPSNTTYWAKIADPGAQGIQGIPGNTGPVGINWRTDSLTILPSTAYAVNDGLQDASGSWRCILAYTSAVTPVAPSLDPTHWAYIVIPQADPLIINVKQKGAIGDGASGAADTAAFSAAINAINTSANGGEIVVPTPSSTYNITSALPAFTKPCRVRGSVMGTNNPGSVVTYAAGLVGLDFTAAGATGSHVEGLHLKGSDTVVGTNDGIRLGSRTRVDFSLIEGFGRDGLNADSTGAVNCNTCGGIGTRVVSNKRHGIYLAGSNSNVHVWVSLEAWTNGGWGIWNTGLYANTFINPLCDGNGAATLRTPLSVSDAAFTNLSPTVTSATAAFVAGDVGSVLVDSASGNNVPSPNNGVTVALRNSATSINMSRNATRTITGQSLWIVPPGAVYDSSGGSKYINPYVEAPHSGNWVCLDGKYTDWDGDASAVIANDAGHFIAPNYWNFYQRVAGIGRQFGSHLYQSFAGDGQTAQSTIWSWGPGGGTAWANFTLFDYLTGQRYLEFDARTGTQKIGFFGATPVIRPTLTGDRNASPGLAALLTNLAGLGLVTDSTTLGIADETVPQRPTILARETFPRAGAAIANVAPPFVSGQLYGQAITLYAGDVVTNVVLYTGTTASATVTHFWVALYDSGGTLLRQSTDATTVLAANAVQTVALSAPFTIATTGRYYLVFMTTATTMPSMVGVTVANTLAPTAAAPFLGVTDTVHTALAATAPAAATFSAAGQHLYMGAS